jgi:hypothetical protein
MSTSRRHAMAHGGQPGPGSNPFITIDGTALKVIDPSGADTNVIPVGTAFDVAMEFTIDGIFKTFLVAIPLTYTVTYTFDGRGIPDGPAQTTGPKTTTAAKFIYGDADTKVTVPATALPQGVYELTAVVTFAGGLPMSAFIDLAVLEIF